MACEVSLQLADDDAVVEVVDAGDGHVLIAGFRPDAPTGTEALVEVVLDQSGVARLITFLEGINMENMI